MHTVRTDIKWPLRDRCAECACACNIAIQIPYKDQPLKFLELAILPSTTHFSQLFLQSTQITSQKLGHLKIPLSSTMFTSLLSITTLISTALAGTYLGGIDMNRACNEQWPRRYAQQHGNGCDAWKCEANWDYVQLSVDVNRACSKQHGGGAYGYCTSGAWGWGCYRD